MSGEDPNAVNLSEWMMEAPSAGESMSDILSAYMEYNPQLAEQLYGLLAQYAPQEQQLSLDLSSQFLPQYYDLYQGLISQERTANMEDVLRLAPYMQQIQAAGEDPAVTAMRKELIAQVQDELNMGSSLTAEQARNAEEYARSAQIARGTSAGQGAANRESVKKALEGMELQTERQAKAQSIVGSYGQQLADPYSTVLGSPTTATSMAAAQFNTGLPATQTVGMLPSTDFYSQNYWNSANAGSQANMYNLGLLVSSMNPYLSGSGISM